MKTVETDIAIAAPPARVWQVLTEELPAAPQGFGMIKFEGRLAPGARITLWSEVAPERAFVLKVAVFEVPRRMVWQGGLPLGLFTGTRTFCLSATEAGTHFAMREVFTGLFAKAITWSMPDLAPSFAKFANHLKERAET